MATIFSRARDVLGHVFTPEKARADNEQPGYTILRAEGDIEVRDYPALLVAQTTCRGERDTAETEGFKRLFSYIQGKDRPGDDIAMTAPVFHVPHYGEVTEEALDRDHGETTVRFVMPGHFTKDTLPPPATADVTVAQIPARRVAVVRFSGDADDEDVAEHTQRLKKWVGAEGLTAAAGPEFAIYDPPFTPPPSRRNEVLIPIKGEERPGRSATFR